ncbi:helix-turn-helix domain-containing protein [Pseudactinotalea sp.]|uniref:helix-turn-helix domain-containing protein n=1 Tax=Pseudactinotalea sp. TaxID=1926260 RepID=UPI003B3A4415
MYELVWLLAGSVEITVVDRHGTTSVLTARPGDAVLMRAGDRDHYRYSSSAPSRHAYVHFTMSDPGPLRELDRWPRLRHFVDLPAIGALCDYLIELARDPAPEAFVRSVHVLETLLEIFVEGPVPDAERATAPAPLIAALDHVRRSWSSTGMVPIPVAAMASAAHVSTGHLHRVFQRSVGASPARVLEIARMTRAAHSLLRTDATVREVARLCGYHDQFHFARRFRSVYGSWPTHFRSSGLDPVAPVQAAGLNAVIARMLPSS